MTTPNTPTPPNPGSRWRRLRPSRRGATIGAVVVALLIVAGVAAALLTRGNGPGWDDHHGPRGGGPGVGLADGFGELGGRGGPLGRDLGDDTLLVGTVVSTADGRRARSSSPLTAVSSARFAPTTAPGSAGAAIPASRTWRRASGW